MRKTHLKIVAGLILVTLGMFGKVSPGSGKAEAKGFHKYLNKQYTGFKIMTLDDLDSGLQNYLMETFPKLVPGSRQADFNGDGWRDYAVLLVKIEKEKSKLLFAIFLQTKADDYNLVEEMDLSDDFGRVFLFPRKTGEFVKQTEAVDAPPKEVKLKHPAVEVEWFEHASEVYYWDDKQKAFDTILTSD